MKISKEIIISEASNFYPNKSDKISDQPASDSGGNFGRLARSGVMKEYIEMTFNEKLAGIPLFAWQQFLSIFTESSTDSDVEKVLDRIAKDVSAPSDSAVAKALSEKFKEIAALIMHD